MAIASSLDHFAPEAFDLIRGHRPEIIVITPRLPTARCRSIVYLAAAAGRRHLIKITKQREAAVFQFARAVVLFSVKPGDAILNQLGNGGVLANDDKAGRDFDARNLPNVKGLLVVPVKRRSAVCSRVGSCNGSSSPPFAHLFSAFHPGYSPKDYETWAFHLWCRECFPPLAREAISRCRIQSRPSARSHSWSMGTLCLRRNRSHARRTVLPTDR